MGIGLIFQPLPILWAGTINSDWATPETGFQTVPTALNDVTIPNAPFNWPVKTGNLTLGADCEDLTIAPNAQLTVTGDFNINTGRTLVMNIGSNLKIEGNWNNNGTFTPGMGIVDFSGISNATINSPPGGVANLINDNISVWPGNWNGNIGVGGANTGVFDQFAGANAGGNSPEARFSYINSISTRRLYYNPVNTTGLSSLSLDFKHSVDHFGSGYTVKVQYSTNGTTWNDAGWAVTPSGNIPASNINLALSTAQGVGAPNYYIAFTITGNLYQINYWYIDDVVLSYNLAGTENFFDLTVSKLNAEVATNGSLNVNGNFNLKPSAQFTTSTGNTLSVTGATFFEADATGMASFLDMGTSNFASLPFVQQFLINNNWHYVSIPVTGAMSGVYTGIYLRTFDEPTDTWNPYITGQTVPLDNTMLGYAAWASVSPATVLFNGPLKNGPYSIPVTRNTIQTDQGWNLVGNPYVSSLDWDAAGWTKTNVNNTIYYYSGNGGTSNYKYYIGSGGETPGVGANSGTNEIPPHQGFFIHVNTGFTTGTLGVSNLQRIHSGQAFYKEGNKDDIPLIRIEAEGSGLTDETVVRFFTEANAEFDGDFDAYKLFAENYPQVYTITPLGTELAISSLPEISEELVVPVAFVAPSGGAYSFTFTELIGFDQVGDLYLEDLLAEEIVEIDENTVYSFDYSPENNNDRFLLHFSNPLGIPESSADNLHIYSFGDVIYIKTSDTQRKEVSVHNMIGQEVLHSYISENGINRIRLDGNTGYYLVSVQCGDQYISKKVFIK
ncbi:MAG: T9SS type A sorting domain-containing protein [Bacteroidales bacterium]